MVLVKVTKALNKVIKMRVKPSQLLLLASFSYSFGANGTKIFLVTFSHFVWNFSP
jgi:GH24 family phage-related lysozyme (muramidase)